MVELYCFVALGVHSKITCCMARQTSKTRALSIAAVSVEIRGIIRY